MEITWQDVGSGEQAGQEDKYDALYVAELGSQVEYVDTESTDNGTRHTYKVYGDCTVTIDRTGWLGFEFAYSTPSNHYEDPPDDCVIQYGLQCASVEAAKSMAAIVALDMDSNTDKRWAELGFAREVL